MCAGVAALLRLHQPQHGPVHAGGERRGGRGQGLAGARPVDGDHPRGGEHSFVCLDASVISNKLR